MPLGGILRPWEAVWRLPEPQKDRYNQSTALVPSRGYRFDLPHQFGTCSQLKTKGSISAGAEAEPVLPSIHAQEELMAPPLAFQSSTSVIGSMMKVYQLQNHISQQTFNLELATLDLIIIHSFFPSFLFFICFLNFPPQVYTFYTAHV